jgi:hypothetical protein
MSRMLNRIRILSGIAVALFAAGVALSPSLGEDVGPPPFRAHVDMKTFMEHVLTPAAKIVWSVNGVVIDEKGMICRPKPRMIGSGSSAAPRRLRKRPTL